MKKSPTEMKKESVALYRNEAFDNGFYEYFRSKQNNRISQILNSVERNIKLESITYRQLNSWEKEGLLSVQREGREWRRFSIIDAIWVKLIKELREFGVTWKQLKVTKESLEFESKKCGVAMPLLEFYIAFAVGNKMPVLLLIFKDGIAVPCSFTQYKVAKEAVGVDDHIQINLNAILQSMFPEIDLKPKQKIDAPVSVNEMELLALLRLGNYEKVELRFKKGKMELFEGIRRFDAMKRIQELRKEHKYQDITYKQDDGVIVAILQTIKERFSKGNLPD
jgi:DNA-binding transcriptional MerR regulator